MFITPMQKLDGISLPQFDVSPKAETVSPFKSMFQDIIQDVIDTDKVVAEDVQALATGKTDDLHTLGIDQAKAQLSVQMMVQLRNRLMESYSEIMRINL